MEIALPLLTKTAKGQWVQIDPPCHISVVLQANNFGVLDAQAAALDSHGAPREAPTNLYVTLLDARNLLSTVERPLCNPYVVVVVGDQRRQSSVFRQTNNAVWNQARALIHLFGIVCALLVFVLVSLWCCSLGCQLRVTTECVFSS